MFFIEENPELTESEEKNDTHYLWMWFWIVFEKDCNKYLEIVNRLMAHSEKEVKKTIANIIALHKFNNYIASETEENSDCYKFVMEYTEYHNDRDPNRETKKIVNKNCG